MATSSLILQSFLNSKENKRAVKYRPEKGAKKLIQFNKQLEGGDFLVPLSYYLSFLDKADHTLLAYFTNERELDELLHKLRLAYLLLLTQQEYELNQRNFDNVKKYEAYKKRCIDFIDTIHYNRTGKDTHKYPLPIASDGYPVKFLSIFMGKEFVDSMVEMIDHQQVTQTIKGYMGAFNEKRLYWVWCSSFLKALLEILPTDFFNVIDASNAISAPGPYTGTLSWALYYFRFSINLFLLLKHTIRGSWLSEEEKKQTWKERFFTQWDQRKFALLNDSVWATGNLVCFFWLTGKTLGPWGDLLTVALLVFDLALAIWEYEEEKTKHYKQLKDYNDELDALKLEQNNAIAQTAEQEEQINYILNHYKNLQDIRQRLLSISEKSNKKVIEEIIQLEIKKRNIQKDITQCEREWRFKNIGLCVNIGYAVGLMLAFFVMTLPFIPIAGPAILATAVAGAVLCLAFTVIYNGIKGGIEIYKAKQAAKEARQDMNDKIEEFKVIKDSLNPDEQRMFFLEIKRLEAETEYQRKLVTYQGLRLIRSILLEALAPAIIFASFVFLPLGIGLAVVGAVIGVAIATHYLLDANFKPHKDEILTFDGEEFNKFLLNPDSLKKEPKARVGLFTAPESDTKQISSDEERALLDQSPSSMDGFVT